MTSTIVKEKPILFSGEMVRAILAGRKTMTRRVIRCECNAMHNGTLLGEWGGSIPPFIWDGNPEDVAWRWRGPKPQVGDWIEQYQTDVDDHASTLVKCPYGKVGTHLWVRETWMPFDRDHGPEKYAYRASTTEDGENIRREYIACGRKYQWRPSIHMPRKASRITLEITEVRVERLQAISEADAKAEGIREMAIDCKPGHYFREMFQELWQSINGKRPGCDWQSNPWVWAISFRQIEATRGQG